MPRVPIGGGAKFKPRQRPHRCRPGLCASLWDSFLAFSGLSATGREREASERPRRVAAHLALPWRRGVRAPRSRGGRRGRAARRRPRRCCRSATSARSRSSASGTCAWAPRARCRWPWPTPTPRRRRCRCRACPPPPAASASGRAPSCCRWVLGGGSPPPGAEGCGPGRQATDGPPRTTKSGPPAHRGTAGTPPPRAGEGAAPGRRPRMRGASSDALCGRSGRSEDPGGAEVEDAFSAHLPRAFKGAGSASVRAAF